MKSSRYLIFSLYFVTNKYECYRNVPLQKTFPMNTNILYLWSQKIITKMSKWINYWLHMIVGLGTHAVRDALWSRWCLRWSVVSCCVSQRFKQLALITNWWLQNKVLLWKWRDLLTSKRTFPHDYLIMIYKLRAQTLYKAITWSNMMQGLVVCLDVLQLHAIIWLIFHIFLTLMTI